MIKITKDKIITTALGLLVAGAVASLIFVFFSSSKTKQDNSTNPDQSKNLSMKISKVLDETLPNSNIILNVSEDPDTPGSTEKVIGSENEFKLTIQSTFFVSGGRVDTDFLKKVLAHEMMHVLSLQDNQFSQLNRIQFTYTKAQFDGAESQCKPNYFNTYGCFGQNSYLSVFYQKFWVGESKIEYDQIQQIENKQEFSKELASWGKKYSSQFVSDVAFSDPEEDMAESFSIWVIGGDTKDMTDTQKAKVDFFDNYPQLKTVREKYLESFGREVG